MNQYIQIALLPFLLLNIFQKNNTTKSHPQSGTLRVMTYNIHHANPPSRAKDSIIDLNAIANVINKVKPDLVSLQEVDVNNQRAGISVNEAYVLSKLTHMYFYFSRSILYRGGEYGNAVLSRYPILESRTYHLPIVPGAKEETRSVCMIKVSLPGKKDFFFASTHLGITQSTRLLQAHKLISILKGIKIPVIIGGDFNATPDSKLIQLLNGTLTRSCQSDCDFTVPNVNAYRKIDYIMYRPKEKWKVLRQQIIPETYASDHLPVITTFEF